MIRKWQSLQQQRDTPRPLQVMKRYMERHSKEVAANSTGKFIVAHVACASLGNRLHEMLYAAMWAIILDRTLIVDYMSQEVCWKYANANQYNPKLQCSLLESTSTNCLDLAKWVPRLNDLSNRLMETPSILPLELLLNVTATCGGTLNESILLLPDDKEHWNRYDELADQKLRDLLLCSKQARERAESLFAWGPDAAYGMMLTHLVPTFLDSSSRNVVNVMTGSKNRVAMHSRHASSTDKGCDIADELSCLDHHSHDHCEVTLLTDRTCTSKELQKWSKRHECTIQTMDSSTLSNSHTKQVSAGHGPHAERFVQELQRAASSKYDRLIGTLNHKGQWRSSSLLLLELIEYQRRVDAWNRGEDPYQVEDLPKCGLRGPNASIAENVTGANPVTNA